MRRLPDTFSTVFILCVGAIALFFHLFYEEVFKAAILRLASSAFGSSEAELMSGLADASVSILCAIAVGAFLYRYQKRLFEKALDEIVRSRIKLGSAKTHLEFPNGRTLDQQHLEVQNAGKGLLRDCLVTIDKVEWDDGAKISPGVALATVARAREGTIGRFYLDAGAPKQLLLTSRDLSDSRNPGAHTLMGENYPIPLYRGKSGIIHVTAVAAEGDPDRLALRFAVDEKYVLTFAKVG